MTRTIALVTAALLLAPALLWAQDAAPGLSLQYAPTVGDREESALLGKLVDLQLNEVSLGISGQISGTLKTAVIQTDQDNGQFTLRVEIDGLKAEFANQPRQAEPIPPAEVLIARTGEVLKVTRPGAEEGNPLTAGLQAITTGGVPLDMVALMACSLRLPDTPVAVGDSWTVLETQDLPIVGPTRVTTVTRLVKVEGTRAFLESNSTADVQAFEMAHPLFEGATIKVESGKFTADKVERELDMARSLIVRAKGAFKVALVADMGFGGPTPMAAVGQFDLKPAAETAPPAEANNDNGQAPAGPAHSARPGVTLGPLAGAAEYVSGVLSLWLGVDMSRAPLPVALAHLRPLLNATRGGVELRAGVAGPEAGRVGIGGQAQLGPWAARRDLNVDLRAVASSLIATGLGFVRRGEVPQVGP